MRAIIVILSMLICGCATLTEKLTLSYGMPAAGECWVERTPPTVPLNAAETLAVQSASGLMTLQRVGEAAYYEGHEALYTIVRFEQAVPGEDATTVKYRIRNGLVYGETIPAVVTTPDPQKEEFAREVAFDAMHGTTPNIPLIYGGRMFIAQNNTINRCTVEVVEKDLDREYVTYRIKTC